MSALALQESLDDMASPTPQAIARQERSLQLALAAAKEAEENRGQGVVILDLREQTPIFDYFVIATGASQRQLRAMADAIDDVLQKNLGQTRLSVDGYQDSAWIVLDYGPLVVQLFDEKSREYYRLEDLWAEAARVSR